MQPQRPAVQGLRDMCAWEGGGSGAGRQQALRGAGRAHPTAAAALCSACEAALQNSAAALHIMLPQPLSA